MMRFLWLLCLLLIGCGAPWHANTHKHVMISPLFTPEQQQVIIQAGDKWVKTVNDPNELTIDYQIGSFTDPSHGVMDYIYIEPNNPLKPLSCGPNHPGCTEHFIQNEFSVTTLDTTYGNLATLSHVAQHEIGHALGLQHTDVGTVMYYISSPSSVQNAGASQDVTCADVEQYLYRNSFIGNHCEVK